MIDPVHVSKSCKSALILLITAASTYTWEIVLQIEHLWPKNKKSEIVHNLKPVEWYILTRHVENLPQLLMA